MGKNKKNRRVAKKANPSQSALLKKQQKAERRAKLEESRAKERSEYLIIRSDEERPEMKTSKTVRRTVVKTVQESIPAETALESNLKRISLAEIQRYMKTSSEAYDKAYDEMLSYGKEIEALDNEIKSIRTKKDASAEEKLENANKRKELKGKKSVIEKRLIISKANTEALERSSDEYSHIVALLKGMEVQDLRKKPRLNPKKIDLTKEEEEELVARYLESKKPKAKKSSATETKSVEVEEEVIETEEASSDVKTLKVLGSKDEKKAVPSHNKEAVKAVEPKKEIKTNAKSQKPKKSWITWTLIVVVVIVLALCLKSCHLKKSEDKEEVQTAEATIEAPKPQTAVKEESVAPKEESKTASIEEIAFVPVDSETINILGYSINAEFKDDSVSLTVPEGVSSDDVSSFLSYVAGKYPELNGATYEIDGDKVTLNAPSNLISSIRPVLKETLEREINEYIEELSAYSETCNFYGYDIAIKAYTNKVKVAYPSIVTEDDVLDFLGYTLKEYPELKDSVTYTISKDHTVFDLSFNLSDEEKRSMPGLLAEEIISYLALTYGNQLDGNISGYKTESSTITIEATVPVQEETESAVSEEAETLSANDSNSYRTSVSFRPSVLYLINKDSVIKDPSLYQSYGFSLSFDNILKLGKHTGFGVKTDGAVIVVPKNGDYENVSGASSFFNGSNWVGAYSIGLDAIVRIDFSSIAFYGAFGSGYIYSDSSVDSYMGFNSWYINGEVGAEYGFTDNLYLGLYAEYKNLGEGKRNYIGGGLALGVSF